MRAGELYRASEPEVRADYVRAQQLVRAVNATAVEDIDGRRPFLAELLGSLGAGSDVLPPVQCDYGRNVHLGAEVFVNFGAVFVDTCDIAIGDQALIGPGVQFLTADHPLDPALRRGGWESGRPDRHRRGCVARRRGDRPAGRDDRRERRGGRRQRRHAEHPGGGRGRRQPGPRAEAHPLTAPSPPERARVLAGRDEGQPPML